MLKYEQDYLNLCHRVLEEGEWVYNERTGKKCLTVINHDFVYDVSKGEVPLLTTKQCFTVSAIAEIIGYLRKYTNAQDFANIGSPTWFSNANKNTSWNNNPHRKGENDLGLVYGAVTGDTLEKIYNNLSKGIDDRGEIYQMWKPETFEFGCLRPCAFEHIWSLVNGKLSLTVTQRSGDLPLGVPFNSLSFVFLLKLMAKITGNIHDKVYHKIINCHIYEDQIEPLKEQLSRTPLDIHPELKINGWVQHLEDVTKSNCHAREYFTLTGYEHLGKIVFPFSE